LPPRRTPRATASKRVSRHRRRELDALEQRLRQTVLACAPAFWPMPRSIRPRWSARAPRRADAGPRRRPRVIRLHPEDLALLGHHLPEDWHCEPDPTLERGAVRVDGAMGGVEDGPRNGARPSTKPSPMLSPWRCCSSLHPALPMLARLANAHPDLAPRRYGRLSACDGGLLEVSGLQVPIGTQCRIAHGRGDLAAEVIGFRNGRSLMMLLGDPVLLRPGARVRPEGRPGMVPVGEAFLGRAVDGEGQPIDGGPPLAHPPNGPPAACAPARSIAARCACPFDTGVRAQCADHVRRGPAHRHHGRIGRGQVGPARHGRPRRQAEIVIVGLIGERAREVSDFVERHMTGARARTAR
jgi:hypothetical protein